MSREGEIPDPYYPELSMDQDSRLYSDLLMERDERFDSLCSRCGECCGAADSDPCAKLLRAPGGGYFCSGYEIRTGIQRTVSGKEFRCVEIRERYRAGTLAAGCAYKAYFANGRTSWK